jgi:hypothetical protein
MSEIAAVNPDDLRKVFEYYDLWSEKHREFWEGDGRPDRPPEFIQMIQSLSPGANFIVLLAHTHKLFEAIRRGEINADKISFEQAAKAIQVW